MNELIAAYQLKPGDQLHLDLSDFHLLRGRKIMGWTLSDYIGWGETEALIEIVKVESYEEGLRIDAQDKGMPELQFDFYAPRGWLFVTSQSTPSGTSRPYDPFTDPMPGT